jgi:three-Cys-motif partner protein
MASRPQPKRERDASPKYWTEYTNLQRVKHALIRKYLGGWFPKLALGYFGGRVLYIDTHAGRGTHLSGELGSPLVALHTLLDHRLRDTLLRKSECRFVFIERDEENGAALKEELEGIKVPDRVKVQAVTGESFRELEQLVQSLEDNQKQLAPAFIFVDPYGFKIPGSLLRRLFNAGRTELFINVIWRELDMAIAQARDGHETFIKILNDIFDGDRWRTQITSDDFDIRADQAANCFAEMVGAKWPTYIRMLGDNDATRYLLLHLSNHDDGRDLMKDCMWSVCPDGGFYTRKSIDITQQVLIEPEPDLKPLRRWLVKQLQEGPKRWSELEDLLRPEIWRMPQLNDIIREGRKDGWIAASDYEGKFTRPANPLLSLVEDADGD